GAQSVSTLRVAGPQVYERGLFVGCGHSLLMDGAIHGLRDSIVVHDLIHFPPLCGLDRSEEALRRLVEMDDNALRIGHDHRIIEIRQRGVGHGFSAMEPLLFDSARSLEFLGHSVESSGKSADLVASIHFDSLVEMADADLLRLPRKTPQG